LKETQTTCCTKVTTQFGEWEEVRPIHFASGDALSCKWQQRRCPQSRHWQLGMTKRVNLTHFGL